jgi:hypothetical protein
VKRSKRLEYKSLYRCKSLSIAPASRDCWGRLSGVVLHRIPAADPAQPRAAMTLSIVEGRLLAPAELIKSLLPTLTSLPCVCEASVHINGAFRARLVVVIAASPHNTQQCIISGLNFLADLGPEVEVVSLGLDLSAPSSIALHLHQPAGAQPAPPGDENDVPQYSGAYGSKRKSSSLDQVRGRPLLGCCRGGAGAGPCSCVGLAAGSSRARMPPPQLPHDLFRGPWPPAGPPAPRQGAQAGAAAVVRPPAAAGGAVRQQREPGRAR